MSTLRIGLYTPRKRRKKGQSSTITSYVEVASAQDLAAKLVALGAKRVGLIRKDRAGEMKADGETFAPSALTAKHLDWLGAKSEEFEVRGLYYD